MRSPNWFRAASELMVSNFMAPLMRRYSHSGCFDSLAAFLLWGWHGRVAEHALLLVEGTEAGHLGVIMCT